MRFFEVDSAVDAIMSAAMVAQGRASQSNKQGKLSMNGFLQMLANSDVIIDYDGFKTVFDTNPALQNVIAKFDKDSITFVGDSDDEGEGYEEPQTDMPDDERVAKMAKQAMRTREFVESKLNEDDVQALMRQLMRKDGIDPDKVSDGGIFDKYRAMARKMLGESQYNISEDAERIIRVRNIQWDADDPADVADLPRNVDLKINVPYDADEDDIDDIVADELTDRYGFTHGGFETQFAESVMLSKDMREKIANLVMKRPTKGVVPALEKYGKKFADFVQKKMDEGELPPHLAKMFGKDGKQVDTRTEVMRQMRDIVANKESKPVVFGDGKMRVDMYTASVLTQIYDKVNDNSKEAIIQRIGTKEKFTKLMPKLFNMLGESTSLREGLEDKIRKDIEAGMSNDAIIGKYANKRTTNTDQIRKIIMDLKFKMRFKEEVATERSLTKAEKSKMKHYEKKLPKQDFIDRYGKEGEAIYYATATKMAKKHA